MLLEFDLGSDLQKLKEHEALEVCVNPEDKSVAYIPYMMNDAIECYIKLTGCTVQGKWDKSIEYGNTFSLEKTDTKNGIIFSQATKNVVSVWYEKAEKVMMLYQYHRICHLWRKGDEELRRLVYIIGTLHDKAAFMGKEYCRNEELELIPLMEFAPFRYFSPIKESLDDYYTNSLEGAGTAYTIAKKIGDERLMKAVDSYRIAYMSGKLTKGHIKKCISLIRRNLAFIDYLNSLVEKASIYFEIRQYDEAEEAMYEAMRENTLAEYQRRGYAGSYPLMEKGKKKALLYEEHPFVMRVFEYDDYDFKINVIERG